MTLVTDMIDKRKEEVAKLNKLAYRTVELSNKAGLDQETSILAAELRTMHTIADSIYYLPLTNKSANGEVPHVLLMRILEVNQAIVSQFLLAGF